MVLPATLPPQARMMRSAISALRRSFSATTVSTMLTGRARFLRGAREREAVFGEARAAEARPGMQELAADAPVEPDAARHVLDVGADLLAEIGDLVDEGDLGREKTVGGVFDELGRLQRGEENRRLDEIERAVKLAQHGAGALALGADHHPVGAHEVLDRRALAQELGIGGDVELPVRPAAAHDLRDLAPGPDRHGRFRHDHGIAGQRGGDFLRRGEDIGQVGMAVAAARGRADRDEDGIGRRRRRRRDRW